MEKSILLITKNLRVRDFGSQRAKVDAGLSHEHQSYSARGWLLEARARL